MPRGDFQGNVGFSQELIFTEMFSKMFLRCNFVRSLFPVLKEGWLWSGVDFQRNVSELFFLHCQGSIFREMFEILKEGWLWSGVDFQRNVSELLFFTLSGVNFQGNV